MTVKAKIVNPIGIGVVIVRVRVVKVKEDEGLDRGLEREIVNHRNLDHPNIVRFHEASRQTHFTVNELR